MLDNPEQEASANLGGSSEYSDAIRIFAKLLADSNFHTIEDFQRANREVADQVDPDRVFYLEDVLYSYYGVEALPKLFPQVKRSHFAINYMDKTATAIEPDAYSHLPKDIDGVPIEEIIRSVAGFMSDKAVEWVSHRGRKTASRIELADGRCSLSSPLAESLRTEYPTISGNIHHLRIPGASRRADPPLLLSPLSDGHSIVGIDFTEGDKPMMLQVDPTIAQVDLSNKYDIEVSAIPHSRFQDVLKLRYRTNPQSVIRVGK